VLRIVSCSSIILLKRVKLLLKGIILAAQLRPEKKFKWSHFGDGPEMGTIQEMLKQLPNNAAGNLVGFIPNDLLMLFYKNNPVDVFVNVSESEGGSPVSIMEAISCGIPAIVTNVGGNPEIVTDENGILLSADPTAQEIAQALIVMLDNRNTVIVKRKAARGVWKEKYNAKHNFNKFSDSLKTIRES